MSKEEQIKWLREYRRRCAASDSPRPQDRAFSETLCFMIDRQIEVLGVVETPVPDTVPTSTVESEQTLDLSFSKQRK